MDFGKAFMFGIIALFSIAIITNLLSGVTLPNTNSPTGYVILDQPEPLCIDSDDGRVYKAGATSAFGSTVADFCIDETNLKEFYCEGQFRTSREVVCPFGCENGACK